MRVVIQRVTQANVVIEGNINGQIEKGMMILVGIEEADGDEDIAWLTKKIVNLRIFDDEKGVMNLSILDKGGDILLISQFTLHASTAKGNRPSYIKAAKPDVAIPLYEKFLTFVENSCSKKPGRGIFGADMKVRFTNDGPVTIILDSEDYK